MLILMMMMAANQQKQKYQQKQQHQQHQQRGGQSAVRDQANEAAQIHTCSMADCNDPTNRDPEVGKSSNSSNETVIARLDAPLESASNLNERASQTTIDNYNAEGTTNELKVEAAAGATATTASSTTTTTTATTSGDETMFKKSANYEVNSAFKAAEEGGENCHNNGKRTSRFKSFLVFTSHLNPFHHHNQQHSSSSNSNTNDTCAGQQTAAKQQRQPHHHHLALLELAQRYFCRSSQSSRPGAAPTLLVPTTKSAPVTPVKWQPLEGTVMANGGPNLLERVATRLQVDEGELERRCDQSGAAAQVSRQADGGGLAPMRPSVRFAEAQLDSEPSTGANSDERRRKAGRWTTSNRQNLSSLAQPDALASQHNRRTQNESAKIPGEAGEGDTDDDDDDDDDHDHGEDESINVVDRLFALPKTGEQLELRGEVPMDSSKFRQYGYSLIDYISNYLDTIDKRRVTPLNIEPGYLKTLIQASAPERGESFANIMHDFENHIMCGITHWQHPHFHAYFPAGNAYPSILADMLSDALGCVGFSWAASPAYTELEIIMLDWMGKMIGLPDEFLCLSEKESKGGGVIQGSASECVLVNLLAARHWAMEKLRKKYPNTPDGLLLTKLVGYCSKEAHSCVEKAAMIGFIRMRALDTDEKHSLRGETLQLAISNDMANGLEPFLVCATLGTTSCCSFDNLEELGQVCQKYDIWLQVDAAYAGSALICPEFKHLIKGIELVTSFNMNPNKWMLINFDCSLMWVKDRFKLTRAFVVDPLYLQHSFSDQAIDYRHWGIPLSRRFRALKLWFVIRNYGIEGLQGYIRNHVKLAKLFEQCIRQDQRFMITNEVVLGLVCFRLIGSNALNQRLLSMINASGKLHMVPASVNGRYVIRFCVCDQNAKESDIRYAYKCISDFASELFESIKAGKERIRAISQQNTIDVSSVSLHAQQSASADRLNSVQAVAAATAAGTNTSPQQQMGAATCPAGAAVSPREAARKYLVTRRNSRHGTSITSSDAPGQVGECWSPNGGTLQQQQQQRESSALVKQASMVQEQQQVAGSGSTGVEEEEDLEQEIVLDSLATIDGLDYDLEDDDDDLLEPPFFDDQETGATEIGPTAAAAAAVGAEQPTKKDAEQVATANELEWRSPVARRWHSRRPIASRASSTLAHHRNQALSRTGTGTGTGAEQEEAEDEVFTLAERRNRMSLRYKREFFVRVVSDPRVYRASISGDINAHASCCSLGGPQVVAAAAAATAAQPAAKISQDAKVQVAATTTTTTTSSPAKACQDNNSSGR